MWRNPFIIIGTHIPHHSSPLLPCFQPDPDCSELLTTHHARSHLKLSHHPPPFSCREAACCWQLQHQCRASLSTTRHQAPGVTPNQKVCLHCAAHSPTPTVGVPGILTASSSGVLLRLGSPVYRDAPTQAAPSSKTTASTPPQDVFDPEVNTFSVVSGMVHRPPSARSPAQPLPPPHLLANQTHTLACTR